MISLTPDVRLCLVCERYLSTSELLIYSVAALTVTSTKLKEKREREEKGNSACNLLSYLSFSPSLNGQ